jgi:hypothetical protein
MSEAFLLFILKIGERPEPSASRRKNMNQFAGSEGSCQINLSQHKINPQRNNSGVVPFFLPIIGFFRLLLPENGSRFIIKLVAKQQIFFYV